MPATFIFLPAFVIGVVAWLAAWWYTHRNLNSPRDEIERLTNHAAWLEQRLDIARQERWDRGMIVSLSDQLGVACHELRRARHRHPREMTAASRR
jgi:hypothetical protein